MIRKVTRYITDVDELEHENATVATLHLLDLCRETLDKLLMSTAEGKALPRAHTVALVEQAIYDIPTARKLYLDLYEIVKGPDESDDNE